MRNKVILIKEKIKDEPIVDLLYLHWMFDQLANTLFLDYCEAVSNKSLLWTCEKQGSIEPLLEKKVQDYFNKTEKLLIAYGKISHPYHEANIVRDTNTSYSNVNWLNALLEYSLTKGYIAKELSIEIHNYPFLSQHQILIKQLIDKRNLDFGN